ncbi:MAG TPA: GEVED domain-containing protein, partial [Bacteroidia bacterium]|nr:GEVED domain-containing protein [Bacteroidia bacterium]
MKNKNYHSVSSTRFTRWIIFANLVILCLFSLSAKAQLTGTKNIPGDYANIAAAVTDLNSQGVGAGGVVFNVAAGNSETAPVGGINLTATGTSSNTIVFQKSGAGANPLIISPVGTISLLTTSTVVDGIFSFNGSDYVTMDGIDLQDNNVSGAAMMEYGYGFFKASASDGCQNNTIMNCVITLNKANNVAGTTTFFQDGCKGIYLGNVTRTAMTTDLVVSTVGGRSNGNTIVTNTIQNVFEGIYMRGYGDGVSPYSNIDQNNSIGGNSAGLGNIIRNYGTGTLTTFGIVTFNQNNLLVQYNNINNTAGGGTTHGGTLLGMSITGSFALNNSTYNIKNNTITLGQGTNTAQTQGISIGAAGGTGTVTIDNNTITGFTNTSGATAGAVFGTVLSNTAGATLNITNNTYSNNQISGVLNAVSLQATATAATANINGNAFTNTTMSNNLGVIMITNAAIISSILNINNNNINGLTFNVANSATNNLIQTTTASATLALSISGNNFQNITYSALSTGGMAMIFNSGTVLSENISNNTFTNLNLNATGTVYLMYLSNSTAGSITVNNNSIVTAFAKATGASNIGAFYCLYNFGSPGSGTHNITNNTFSNITTHSTSATLFGIYWQTLSGPTANISGNIVSNWNNSSNTGTIIGMATTYNTNLNTFSNTVSNITNGGPITGIQFGNSSTTTGNCNGNTISGLSSSGASSTVLGINVGTSSGGTTLNVFQNTINTLSGSGASSPVVTGIQVTLGTTVNIYKNKIYDLSQSGAIVTTSPAINGMLFSSGTTVNAYNNLIGDLRAPAASLTDAIRGISVTSTTANASFNVSYNTVNIAASSSGTNFGTTGLFHTISTVATTAKLDLRNNIIVNTSVPNGTGFTVAYRRSAGAASNLANYASGSNNNLFYAGTPAANRLIYFDGTSSAQTISNYRSGVFTAGTIAPRDAASVSENPPFLSVTGSSANFLHIDPTIATQVESAAAPIAGITDDFDGNTRNGSNPDIGADEGNFIVSDLTPPSISYSAFFNTSCLTDRTVSINITDATGVNTTAGTKPRLYFKKSADANTYVGNTSADNGWKYVEATNASSPFSFTTNYSLLQSAMSVGDVIQYFIVAQDVASPINIAINSGTFASPPASVALTATEFPIGGTINSYTLTVAGLSGTVTIGAAGTYTSLTGAGGLFSVINSGGMSGNVTANIIDATVAESGATVLNAINYSGCAAGPFTLTINPGTGVTSVLSGSLSSNALIRLNGADNVIIDGSNSGGTDKSLTITNTSITAPTAVSLISLGTGAGATNNTIKNCNLSTGVYAGNSYGIAVGGSTPGTAGSDNDNVTLQNNSITVATFGIYAVGNAAVSATGMDNLSVNGNSITTNTTVATYGIQLGGSLNSSVSQNTISVNTTAATAPVGISLETNFVLSSVTRNNITNVNTTNTGGYGGRGIAIGTGTATSSLTIANNFISGVNGPSWTTFGNSAAMGIAIGMIGNSTTITNTTGGLNIYYNSVNMYGSHSNGGFAGAAVTAAIYVGSGASVLDIRNNIFVNSLNNPNASGTASKNYAIYSAATNTAFTSINYNDYYVSGTQGVLGNIGATDRTTLAAIQTGFGGNVNSINTDPAFISSSNLHISVSSSSVDNLGTTIAGITIDNDGDTRCPGGGCPGSGTSPDIGADEYTPTPCTGTPAPGNTISSANPACSGASFTLSLQNATPGSGVTYLWESADDAGFTVNLASIGTASTLVTSQTTAKYYRCTVTCSGNSVTSTPLLVTIQTNPAACYCGGVLGTYTNIGCNFGLGIEDVTVAGINNLANGCGGPLPTVYTDYTWLSGNVQQGQSYPITIGRGAFVNNACAFGVWVDWNNNNSFYDAGEFMSILLTGGAGVGQASNTGTLVVPAGATLGSHVMRIRSNFSVAPGSTTACASLYTYGETEDYTINVVNACAGTPVAGTTVSFSALACPNVPFTLYLQGVSPALGLTYQWESSPDNIVPYLPIAGATNPYRVQTQNISTYYRCTITCSNGGGSASSTPLQMNMNTYANCICVTPNYSGNGTGGCTGTTANNYIGNVTFAGINNTTGCGANTPPYYMYFPSQIALVNQTVTYPVTISAPAAGAAFQRFKVFIDFNDNASCDDPGEMVYNSGPISTSVNSTSGFISIAANAPLGTHKFRVRSSNPLSTNQDANSCSDDGYYGEVEEYQITISGPPPCTGTPAPGQTLASTPLACASTSINLSLQFATSGAGVTYQWQSSLNAGFSAPVNLGTSPTETVTQTATTWYRCIVTCSGSDGISTPVMVSYSVPCYCTNPVHGSDGCALGLYINNFTFAGINNTSGCYSNVPYTTPFYSYFPNSVATVVLGVNYPYSITTPVNAGAYTQFFGIWIDFNNNGSFDDAGELIASTTSSTAVNTFSGNYTIPLSSPSGVHKMRIRSGNAAPANSCSAASSGETEDYLIDIACSATASSNSPVCPGATINLSSTFTGSGTPVSYSWTGPNGTVPSVQNPTISSVTPADGGVYTVTITDNTGCSATKTTTVVISPLPDPLASSNAPVCEGSPLNLFGDNIASGQSTGNSWSWSGPSFTSAVQNPNVTGSASIANSGTYTLTVTNSNGCTASSSSTVAVNPNPVLSIATQTNVTCNGDADGSIDLDANPGTSPFLFDLDGSNTLDGIYSGLDAGTYTANVIDDNGCEAASLTVTITEPDVLTVAAGSNSPVCTGTALNLTSTPAGGTAGFTYAWTGPN